MKTNFKTLIVSIGILSLSTIAMASPDSKSSNPYKVAINPDYLQRETGGLQVQHIDLFQDCTLLWCTAWGWPGTSIVADKNLMIRVDGDMYEPSEISGLEFGKPFIMQKWGRQDFTIKYPAIPKNAKVMDVIETNGDWYIYGLRLDGKKYKRKSADQWYAENALFYPGDLALAQADGKGKVTVEGIINNYDEQIANNSFTIKRINDCTGLDEDVRVKIKKDGSFKTSFEMNSPRILIAQFPLSMDMMLFLQPDGDISVYFDGDKILNQRVGRANINQAAIYNAGKFGMATQEIQNAPAVWNGTFQTSPLELTIKVIDHFHNEQVKKLTDYINSYCVSPLGADVLLGNEKAGMIYNKLQKALEAKQDEIPHGFYDFIKSDLDESGVSASKYYIDILKKLYISGFREAIGAEALKECTTAELPNVLAAEAKAVRDFSGTNETPLWWQKMTGISLVSMQRLPTGNNALETLKKLKENGAITNSNVYSELYKYYNNNK